MAIGIDQCPISMVTHLELNKSPVHAHAQTEKLEVCLIKDGIHLNCIGPSVY